MTPPTDHIRYTHHPPHIHLQYNVPPTAPLLPFELYHTLFSLLIGRSLRLFTLSPFIDTKTSENKPLTMVVASLNPVHGDRFRSLAIPVIDLSCRRALVSELIVRACEEFGFFKVIGHGVPVDVVSQMEAAALEFFSLPAVEKQRAGPPNPLGYGSRAIGLNGDFGEVEYLLLHTNPSSISQQAGMVSRKSPNDFRYGMNKSL